MATSFDYKNFVERTVSCFESSLCMPALHPLFYVLLDYLSWNSSAWNFLLPTALQLPESSILTLYYPVLNFFSTFICLFKRNHRPQLGILTILYKTLCWKMTSGPCCTQIFSKEPVKGYLSNLQETVSEPLYFAFLFPVKFWYWSNCIVYWWSSIWSLFYCFSETFFSWQVDLIFKMFNFFCLLV